LNRRAPPPRADACSFGCARLFIRTRYTLCLCLASTIAPFIFLRSPLSSGSFYTAFGVLAATFGYLTYKKAAEPEVFPVYKVVLDEEVRIGKRNADYTINPTYVPKAPQAAKDGF
jgi:hypothetical protein